jgi:hypothetical protein
MPPLTRDVRQEYDRRRRERDSSGSEKGVDYTVLAQRVLFPGRAYNQLTRDECGAVRRKALELMARAGLARRSA